MKAYFGLNSRKACFYFYNRLFSLCFYEIYKRLTACMLGRDCFFSWEGRVVGLGFFARCCWHCLARRRREAFYFRMVLNDCRT